MQSIFDTIEIMLEPEHLRITRVVGSKIKELRRKHGISQQDLADLAQLHAANLGKLERGKGNPKLDTLARIATALNTTLSELVSEVTPEIVEPRKIMRITAKDLRRERERLAGGDE